MNLASLDVSIRIASTDADLREACRVRAESYGHHLPELGERFANAETLDRAPGTAVLLARDKRSGRGVGTLRIQTNRFAPLLIDASAPLPAPISTQPRAEITRLAVTAGADRQVRLALMKASWLYCLANQVRWLVIGARSDALIRGYRALGFADALPGGARVPLAHAGHVPHLLLAFDVTAAERTWHAGGHRLYEFMVERFHPELQLFDAAPLAAMTAPAQRPLRPLRGGWRPRQRGVSPVPAAPPPSRGDQRASTATSSSRV